MTIINNILDFFINSAEAAPAAGNPQQSGNFSLLIIMVVFVGFLYLTVWRPQNKRAKEQREMLGALTKGDEVVTAGGILGKINKVSNGYVVLSIAENTEITVQKSSISTVLPKGTMKAI
jgi:preprotein translocase subunit YajC